MADTNPLRSLMAMAGARTNASPRPIQGLLGPAPTAAGVGPAPGSGLSPYDENLPAGAHIRPYSGPLNPLQQNAISMLYASNNPTGLFGALGSQLANQGMSQQNIASQLASFNPAGGANGGQQQYALRQAYLRDPTAQPGQAGQSAWLARLFAGTPYGQYFGG